jgi:hypothetical protein
LESFQKELRQLAGYGQLVELCDGMEVAFYRSTYEHLLLLLDHTYKDVVKMRYDMLWNLLEVVRPPSEHVPSLRNLGLLWRQCRRGVSLWLL